MRMASEMEDAHAHAEYKRMATVFSSKAYNFHNSMIMLLLQRLNNVKDRFQSADFGNIRL